MKRSEAIVGVKVIVNGQHDSLNFKNKLGVIKHINESRHDGIGILFEERIPGTHSLGGRVRYGHGYWVAPSMLSYKIRTKEIFKKQLIL